MKVFLASALAGGVSQSALNQCDYFLESFYSMKGSSMERLPAGKELLLDSGAFTFMNGKKSPDWNKYVKRYIEFIKLYDIKLFFELDIDHAIGYQKVLDIRHQIEDAVGRPSIPVYHKSRGIEEFKKMCEEYSYAAIGGLVSGSKAALNAEIKTFPTLIKYANDHGCKLHGLGFTRTPDLRRVKFYSVDSSTWAIGGRWGKKAEFRNGRMYEVERPVGTRVKAHGALADYNFLQWCKFQQYAKERL